MPKTAEQKAQTLENAKKMLEDKQITQKQFDTIEGNCKK